MRPHGAGFFHIVSMRRWTLALSITGFVIAILMAVTLLVLWNVYIIQDYRTIHELTVTLAQSRSLALQHNAGTRWSVLVMGTIFFSVIIVVLSLYFAAYLMSRSFRNRQTDWLNQATHELKLPLANVQMFAQTLQRGQGTPQEDGEFLGLIVQETRRMQSLVSRILQARRLDSSSLELELTRIRLEDWFPEIVENQSFPVTMSLPSEPMQLQGDRVLLDAALENLLSNAQKYGDGTPPQLSAHKVGHHVEICVADRGIGVPSRYRKDIFRRFFRTPSPEHRKREGTGLGLHIVRTGIHRHGGEVGLRDNPGGGSVFWIRLPLFSQDKS